jgi:hypothetical protein
MITDKNDASIQSITIAVHECLSDRVEYGIRRMTFYDYFCTFFIINKTWYLLKITVNTSLALVPFCTCSKGKKVKSNLF